MSWFCCNFFKFIPNRTCNSKISRSHRSTETTWSKEYLVLWMFLIQVNKYSWNTDSFLGTLGCGCHVQKWLCLSLFSLLYFWQISPSISYSFCHRFYFFLTISHLDSGVPRFFLFLLSLFLSSYSCPCFLPLSLMLPSLPPSLTHFLIVSTFFSHIFFSQPLCLGPCSSSFTQAVSFFSSLYPIN